MNENAIEINGITKKFGQKTVVNDVSLKIKRGSIFGCLGANGSGKTTTIRMICGLLTPTAGKGYCLGYDIFTESHKIKQKIGYMPQKFCLYNGLTVFETLRFFADIYQVIEVDTAIEQIISDLTLEPYRHIKVGNLSGGWKQRLSLACCLLHRPEMLFLDEPTAGVDPVARKDFWNYLHKISFRDNTTILVTTHYMDEAEKCTDLAYLHLGDLLYTGPTKELIKASGVYSYSLDNSSESLEAVSQKLEMTYPKLLVGIINNELRISSRDKALLEKVIKEQKISYHFKEIIPSFEEIFIGLSNNGQKIDKV